jgi:hypothetical protein
MDLTPTEAEEFSKALLDAFRSVDHLREMVFYKAGHKIDEFTDGPLQNRVFQLICEAEAAGWTSALVDGAIAKRPGNTLLVRFHARYLNSVQRQVPSQVLEKLIVKTNSFLQPVQWRKRLEQVEHQVCRIEIDSRPTGTGFLVGPGLVLSAFHVLKDVIEGMQAAGQVLVRFDHKQAADGVSVLGGTGYRLAADWLLASSPPSKIDLERDPKSGDPSDDELDFVLFRLEGEPGMEVIAGEPRSWITTPESKTDFQSDAAVVILQYPNNLPLQLAVDMNALILVTPNRTRVRYRTNTLPGSSGSPCFDSGWRLIALHHSGDPAFKPYYNEGIPMDVIRPKIASHLVEPVNTPGSHKS